MISLMRPAPTLFLAASLTLYQVPHRRLSNLKERSVELMKTSFHSSVLSTEYCSTKPVQKRTQKMKTCLNKLSTRWQYYITLSSLGPITGWSSFILSSMPPLVTYKTSSLRWCWVSIYANKPCNMVTVSAAWKSQLPTAERHLHLLFCLSKCPSVCI